MSRWTSNRLWSWHAPRHRRLWVAVMIVGAISAPARGQQSNPAVEVPLVTEVYSLRHRPAADAILEVQGLLSGRGTVELQPQGNSLVLRDTRAIVRRVMARLRDYDQPRRQVRIEIQIVQAGGGSQAGPPEGPRLSEELVRR